VLPAALRPLAKRAVLLHLILFYPVLQYGLFLLTGSSLSPATNFACSCGSEAKLAQKAALCDGNATREIFQLSKTA